MRIVFNSFATYMLVTNVRDGFCWWQFWDIFERFKVLAIDFLSWKMPLHNNSATNILQLSISKGHQLTVRSPYFICKKFEWKYSKAHWNWLAILRATNSEWIGIYALKKGYSSWFKTRNWFRFAKLKYFGYIVFVI